MKFPAFIILGGLVCFLPSNSHAGFGSDSEDDEKITRSSSSLNVTSPHTPAESPNPKKKSFNEQLRDLSLLTDKQASLIPSYRHRLLDTCPKSYLHQLIETKHPDLAHLLGHPHGKKSMERKIFKALRREAIDALVLDTLPKNLTEEPRVQLIATQVILHKLIERYQNPEKPKATKNKHARMDFKTLWDEVPLVVQQKTHISPSIRKRLIQHYPDTWILDNLMTFKEFSLSPSLDHFESLEGFEWLEPLRKPNDLSILLIPQADLTATQKRTFKGRVKNLKQAIRAWAVDTYIANQYPKATKQSDSQELTADLPPEQWARILLEFSQKELDTARRRYQEVRLRFEAGKPINPHMFGPKKNRKGYAEGRIKKKSQHKQSRST